MKKQLIVVVHGVGVRTAGVVSDQLSAALEDEADTSGAPQFRPHSSDDFFLHEQEKYARRRLVPTFSAHLRRFRAYDPDNPETVTHERVVADYFWGDISGTGLGTLQMLIGLIKIILGLSHAIRENAVDVFPGPSPRAVWMRRIARAAPLLIHGPIAAINIVLVGGLLLTLGVHLTVYGVGTGKYYPEAYPLLTKLATGVLTVLAGWIGLRSAQVFLLRHLFSWLFVVGLGVILLAGLDWLQWPPFEAAMVWLHAILFNIHCGLSMVGKACAIGATGFPLLGMQLMAAMMLCWGATLLAAVAVEIGWRMPRLFPGRGPVQYFIQPAIGLMTLLWFILMTAVWSLVLLVHGALDFMFTFPLPIGLTAYQLHDSTRLVMPAALAMILLCCLALYLLYGKAKAFGGFAPDDYLPQRDNLAERYRLIVGRVLLWVLTLFTVVMVAAGTEANLDLCSRIAPQACNDFSALLTRIIPSLIAWVGALAVLVVWLGASQLATAVAIFTDVLVYLNDYSWRSREAMMGLDEASKIKPWKTRTLVERGLNMREDQPNTRQRYWLRKRIHSRMQMLMKALVRDEAPDEILIVSHSQGTMIALDVIEASGKSWLEANGGKATLKLVTMGCPYIHIYNSYFPSMFPDLVMRPRLQRVDRGGLLTDWVNIFRVDDFVGTHVDTTRNAGQPNAGAGWPREVPVPANGHTNYWIDLSVFPALRAIARF